MGVRGEMGAESCLESMESNERFCRFGVRFCDGICAFIVEYWGVKCVESRVKIGGFCALMAESVVESCVRFRAVGDVESVESRKGFCFCV